MIYIILSVFLNSLAQLAMKMASEKITSLKALLTSPPIYFAGFFYLLSIGLWLKGLAGTPLSKAYPFQSLGYVLVFAMSFFLLGEKITSSQLVALSFICFGLLLFGVAK